MNYSNINITHHAGKAKILDEKIILVYPHDSKIEIPISKIKIIGEYTTENGPTLDDYFLVFYYSNNSYAEISMYAENINVMIENLSKSLNIELKSLLVNSTVWNSKILYPIESKGKMLWKRTKAQPQTFIEKIKSIFRKKTLKIELTDFAKGYLKIS
jgi:hypothetical protein